MAIQQQNGDFSGDSPVEIWIFSGESTGNFSSHKQFGDTLRCHQPWKIHGKSSTETGDVPVRPPCLISSQGFD